VHAQEAKAFSDKICSLESANLNLTREKDRLFDQLEMRQAELESSNTYLETLQSQTTEYQYQIRELGDRVALLEGELTDAQREANPANGTGMTAEEVARLISAAEAKYEARLAELRGRLDMIEKERVEADAEWNSKVAAKALEVEELKKVIGKSQKSEVDHEAVEEKLRGEITVLKEEMRGHQRQQIEFQRQVERIKESEVSP
jgi:chromosome segregation ATPase